MYIPECIPLMILIIVVKYNGSNIYWILTFPDTVLMVFHLFSHLVIFTLHAPFLLIAAQTC